MLTDIIELRIGDYMLLGKYYDEPILWRCVDIDENGPLMLSDKIISDKSFDAKGNHTYADGTPQNFDNRRDAGSNLWETSNIRIWLNSTASLGNITWLGGCPPTKGRVGGYNAYAHENGFLADSNFTESERNVIREVEQKSLINLADVLKLNMCGTQELCYNYNISEVVQNYDNSYYHNVKDKMFLLDVKQVNIVWKNFGEYYLGNSTQKAVNNSEYTKPLYSELNWNYWLRTPNCHYCILYDSTHWVRFVTTNGIIGQQCAFVSSVGVRPAFYIDVYSIITKYGNGSRSAPYKIN